VLAILGQEEYSNIGAAEASLFSNLDLANFPIVEFRPLWKIVFQTSTGYTNTPKALIANLLDIRRLETVSGAGVAVSDHGLLTGLSDDDHYQYLHVSQTRTGVTAEFNTTGKITTTDKIGIGTTTPSALIESFKDWGGANSTNLSFSSTSFRDSSRFALRRANGTPASPSAVLSGQELGNFNFRGHDGTSFTAGGQANIGADAEENYTATSRATRLRFGTTNVNETLASGRMYLTGAGELLIGTEAKTSTASQLLQVTGGAYVSGSVGIGTTAPAEKLHVVGNALVTGTLSATALSTGATGTGVNISNSGTITGPATIVIDPAAVGDDTGTVSIKGNLEVLGTTTTINSTTLTVADKNIVLASGVSTLANLDTAGIDFGSTAVRLRYNYNGGTNSGLSIEGANVGIGTPAPAGKLHVRDDGTLLAPVCRSIVQSTDQRTIVGSYWASGVTQYSYIQSTNNAESVMGALALNPAGGNVGIGTANPLFNLHVIGTTDPGGMFFDTYGIVAPNITGRRANGTTTAPTAVVSGDNLLALGARGYNGTEFSTNRATIFLRASENWTTTANGTRMEFITTPVGTVGQVTRMLLDDGGNLLLGPTPITATGTASQRLQVNSGAYISGNVGIGTTNPTVPLDVFGASAQLRVRDANVDVRILPLAASSAAIMGTWSNHDLVLYANFTETIRLKTTGNVGIGTTDPVSKLDVRGLVNIAANLSAQDALHLNNNNIYGVNHLRFADPGPYEGIVWDGGNGWNVFESPNDLVTNGPGNLQFTTGTVRRATLDTTGKLQVLGGLDSDAPIREKVGSTYWNVVTQYDIGFNANQVPLNQYLGQLAFIDQYSPSGLRRDGGGSDDLTVDSEGRILGLSPAAFASSTGGTNPVQFNASNTGITLGRWENATGASNILYLKSRGSSVGTHAIVQNGDGIGFLGFEASDGTTFRRAASISINVNGTPSSTSMPGAISFNVTPENSVTSVERFRISQSGLVTLGTSAGFNAPESNTFAIVTNNTERLRVSSTGNVGIGMTNPGTQLDVNGNIRLSGSDPLIEFNSGGPQVFVPAANTIAFATAGGIGTPNERARIDSAGRLLVGTLSTSSVGTTLLLQGNAAGSANAGTLRLARGEATPSDGINIGVIAFTDNTHVLAAQIVGARDGGTWSTSSLPTRLVFSTTANGESTTTERMRITSVGNVGIGITNPSSRLTINGTQFDTVPILSLLSGNQQTGFNNGAQIAFGYDGTNTYQHFIQTRHNAGNSNNAIDFYVSDGTQNNTLTSGSIHTMSLVSGNVGIGSTNPSVKLDVFGGSAAIRNIGGPTGLEIGNGQNSNQFAYIDLTGDTTYADFGLRIIRNNTGANTPSDIIHRGLGDFRLIANESTSIALYTGNTERLRVTGSGNIGVGTINPSTVLDVSATGGMLRIGGASGNNLVQAYTNSGTVGLGMWAGGASRFYSTEKMIFSVNATIGTGAPTGYSDAVTIDASGNLLVNAASTTGTAAQRLQVIGGAYVSGNVGIGVTNPSGNLHIASNAPTITLTDSDSAANEKTWLQVVNSSALYWQALSDAGAGGGNLFRLTRTAEQINAFEGLNGGAAWFKVDNLTKRVGIRTDAPTQALDIRDGNILVNTTEGGTITLYNRSSTAASFPQFRIEHFTSGFGGQPVVELISHNGTSSAPTTVVVGQILGGYNTWGHNGTGLASATRIEGIAEAQFSTAVSAGIRFNTTAAGSQSERVRISGSGNVGISHTQPTSLLHIQSSDAVDVNYLKVSSKYGEYLRRIVVPAKTVAAGTPETFNLYLGRFYNGITKLHIYVEGGFAEEGSEFVFWKQWGSTNVSAPVIKSRSGSSHVQMNLYFQIVDTESYRVFISYTYNAGNVLGEANTLRAVIKSNSNFGVFFVESPNPTIPTLDSTNLMRTDFSIRTDGNVGIGTSNPLWNLVVQENQDSGTVLQVRNDNTATAATSIIQLATSTGGTKYSNLVVSAGGNYFQNIGAGGIATLFQDYNTQVFRTNAGLESARLDTTTSTFQLSGPIYPGLSVRSDANIELGRSRILLTGATWNASSSTMIVITYIGHGFANTNRVDLVFAATSGSNATSGNYAVSNVTPSSFTITNPTSITGSGTCTIGSAGNAYIDFITDTTHADYGLRILRGNFGPNADSMITNRGSGVLTMQTEGAGSLRFLTNSSANASEKMIITSVGNVGIGTANPQTVFDVVGLGQFTNNGATLSLVGADHSYLQFFPDGAAAGRKAYIGFPGATVDYFAIVNEIGGGLGHIILQAGGSSNVGIRTTSPLYDLTVVGRTGIAGDKPLRLGGEGNFTFHYDLGRDAPTGGFVIDGNQTGSISYSFRKSGSSLLDIVNSGNVGIGTSNPAEKLHVQGTITSRSGSGILNMTHDGTNGSLSSSSQLLFYAGGTGNLILHTNNAQRLHINTIGNVGIGTNTPASRLAVNGLITENSGDGVYYNVVTQKDVGFNANQIPLNQYLGQLAFLDQYSPSGLRRDGGGSDDLVIDSNGRIGIGTTLPGGQVGINTSPAWSSFNYGANLVISGSRNNGLGILDSGNTNPWFIGNGGGTLVFSTMPALGDTTTGATTRFTISNTGNVGIGTITPTHRLHIGPLNGNHLYLASGNNAYGWVVDTNDFGAASVPMRIFRRTDGVSTESVTILNQSGNVGIGVTLPTYKLQVNGSFAATTKSFVIDHPTKPGHKLRYGSLEGPENGVYVRGRLSGSGTIHLPEYWTELVDEDSITVNLTPIGRDAALHSVIDISDNTVTVESANGNVNCFFTVFAERKDVERLITEYSGDE
jgi:hypothetical protein